MREGEKSKGETEKKSGKVIIGVQMDALEDVILQTCLFYVYTYTYMHVHCDDAKYNFHCGLQSKILKTLYILLNP